MTQILPAWWKNLAKIADITNIKPEMSAEILEG
jgi:hypothetical protein